ncbi:hypothetical protein K438DRAFT_2034312 [Mycena galopus ATCC 62051]|nr:hypothetical protein K438DRAFT_2034312 [Mycena galopus ATCC 62051]
MNVMYVSSFSVRLLGSISLNWPSVASPIPSPSSAYPSPLLKSTFSSFFYWVHLNHAAFNMPLHSPSEHVKELGPALST